jgi:hypothetical protein
MRALARTLRGAQRRGNGEAIVDADLAGGGVSLGMERRHGCGVDIAIRAGELRHGRQQLITGRPGDQQVIQIGRRRSHRAAGARVELQRAQQVDAVGRLHDEALNRRDFVDGRKAAGDAVGCGDQVIADTRRQRPFAHDLQRGAARDGRFPVMTSASLTVGVISKYVVDPLARVTLPLTRIVPGEAPGDSVPLTRMAPLTVPALPKVAPRATVIPPGAEMVDPASPISLPPLIEMVSKPTSPDSVPVPLSSASCSNPV